FAKNVAAPDSLLLIMNRQPDAYKQFQAPVVRSAHQPDSAPRQAGQYQGAGALTGFGLLRRQRAQRKRLPFTAVFGRKRLPVLEMIFAIVTSIRPWRKFARASRQGQMLAHPRPRKTDKLSAWWGGVAAVSLFRRQDVHL